jgi:hypothetical protein
MVSQRMPTVCVLYFGLFNPFHRFTPLPPTPIIICLFIYLQMDGSKEHNEFYCILVSPPCILLRNQQIYLPLLVPLVQISNSEKGKRAITPWHYEY